MNIKFENYVMVPEDVRFNLTKTVTRKKEDSGEEYQGEVSLGYAMTF